MIDHLIASIALPGVPFRLNALDRTAINADRRTGDIAGRSTQQESGDSGEFLRRAKTSSRNVREGRGPHSRHRYTVTLRISSIDLYHPIGFDATR